MEQPLLQLAQSFSIQLLVLLQVITIALVVTSALIIKLKLLALILMLQRSDSSLLIYLLVIFLIIAVLGLVLLPIVVALTGIVTSMVPVARCFLLYELLLIFEVRAEEITLTEFFSFAQSIIHLVIVLFFVVLRNAVCKLTAILVLKVSFAQVRFKLFLHMEHVSGVNIISFLFVLQLNFRNWLAAETTHGVLGFWGFGVFWGYIGEF